MVQTAGDSPNSVIWRRPFGLPDVRDSPTSPASLGSRSNSWNSRDEVVRRFSEPAAPSDILKTDRYIKYGHVRLVGFDGLAPGEHSDTDDCLDVLQMHTAMPWPSCARL